MSRAAHWAWEREFWFIFGTYSTGHVDISNPNDDVLKDVPRVLAEAIVEQHNDAVERAVEGLTYPEPGASASNLQP